LSNLGSEEAVPVIGSKELAVSTPKESVLIAPEESIVKGAVVKNSVS
jgi:hypothetical protein